MPSTARNELENGRIILGLLESVERDGAQSQRKLAAHLGIALGLVNAYIKRCVKKGLLKASEAPARRYVYYVTPKGFAEKSKLTVEYLTYSFRFFREARSDCTELLNLLKSHGCRRVVLAGASDLAEIVRICCLEGGVEIVAVVDPAAAPADVTGVAMAKNFDDVVVPFDAVIVTDVHHGAETFAAAVARFGAPRVFAPKLLGNGLQPESI